MTIFMETTEIAPERTVAEIQAVLVAHNVAKVMSEYENNTITSVAFVIKVRGDDVPFRLPCRWQSVAELLRKRAGIDDYQWKANWTPNAKRRAAIEAKAKRVAWRQILRWVQAQMALVETSMVKIDEVFLPYRQMGPKGETVFEMIDTKGLPMLEGPKMDR